MHRSIHSHSTPANNTSGTSWGSRAVPSNRLWAWTHPWVRWQRRSARGGFSAGRTSVVVRYNPTNRTNRAKKRVEPQPRVIGVVHLNMDGNYPIGIEHILQVEVLAALVRFRYRPAARTEVDERALKHPPANSTFKVNGQLCGTPEWLASPQN